MDPADPDREVIQFIVDRLSTVPHLEAILLIWQNQSTLWTAETLSGRIYVPVSVARSIIDDLKRDGLLQPAASGDPAYVYAPDWDARHNLLPRLADLYRRQLVQVTKLIHAKGSSSVREFARAFQLKKD